MRIEHLTETQRNERMCGVGSSDGEVEEGRERKEEEKKKRKSGRQERQSPLQVSSMSVHDLPIYPHCIHPPPVEMRWARNGAWQVQVGIHQTPRAVSCLPA